MMFMEANMVVVENETALSEMISSRMEELGTSINDMARKADITYEHMRGIARGLRVPSKQLLKSLAEILDLDFTELYKLATTERIRHKYGKVADVLAGKTPGMEPIERAWGKLTEDQRATVVEIARSMSKRTKR